MSDIEIEQLKVENNKLKKALEDKVNPNIVSMPVDKLKQLQADKEALELKVYALENAITNIRLKDAREWTELKEENKRMKALISSYGNSDVGFDWGVLHEMDVLEQENERMRLSLTNIMEWSDPNGHSTHWTNQSRLCSIRYAASVGLGMQKKEKNERQNQDSPD